MSQINSCKLILILEGNVLYNKKLWIDGKYIQIDFFIEKSLSIPSGHILKPVVSLPIVYYLRKFKLISEVCTGI